MDWYKPVDIWDTFGVNSRKEYVAKYVVEGKFHKNVPEDISKSFVTVSYLLAHSYYHLPMFDEALSKTTLIMEMAIKLKAKALNIPIERTRNNRRPIKRPLAELINEICNISEYAFLKPDFNRARNLRNYKMHPDRHSFAGAMSFADSNVRLFINIINLLFLETVQLNAIYDNNKELENELSPFKCGLHILEFKGKKILIDGFHMFKYREFDDKKILLLYINPLTIKVREQFMEHKYPEPLIVVFTDFIINVDSIEGNSLDGKPIIVYVDDKEQNLKTYSMYNKALSKVSESHINVFLNFNGNKAIWQMEKIIYENCWVNEILNSNEVS